MKKHKMRKASYGFLAIALTLLLAVTVYQFAQPIQPVLSKMGTFSSYDELKNYIRSSMELARTYQSQFPPTFLRGAESGVLDAASVPKSTSDYSTTNIQVAGVDEADIIKTDGEYLYIVSGDIIYIVKAHPTEQAEVLSKINLNGTYGSEIYIRGDKLAVLTNRFGGFGFLPGVRADVESTTTTTGAAAAAEEPMTDADAKSSIAPYISESTITVYDIADRTEPIQTRTLLLNGTFAGSRMIDDYLYIVSKQPSVRPIDDGKDIELNLPSIQVDEAVRDIEATEVRYTAIPDIYYDFTTIISINVVTDTEEPKYETFLSGQSSAIYVSLENMFLAVPNYNTLENQETSLYRVRLSDGQIVFESEGSVPGFVLNQFSMDEHNNFFRIATTKWGGESTKNNLYTLSMDLDIVGRLEGLAPGEQIYSSRFMGDRLYLVTFRQIDPFFVIDLSDPSEPTVLGYLKIPGFSGYLHPYDENNIIGIGKQDSNVKLSLFNVENVTDPKETAKYIFDGSWSDTPVLWNHKAFLFDESKNLLAFPLSIDWGPNRDSLIKSFWQGAVVFDISLEDGFTLRDGISHQTNDKEFYEGNLEVRRILYIESVLYTISDSKVKMNNMESLELLNELELS